MKTKSEVISSCRPSIYASIMEDVRQASVDCGWGLGIHGSLAKDFDLIAIPFDEDATSFEELVKAIAHTVLGEDIEGRYDIGYEIRPKGRTVAVIQIFNDMYLDISTIIK